MNRIVREASVQAQSKHRQLLLQGMSSDTEMERDWDVVTDSDVLEVFCEPVSYGLSRLVNVQRRSERTRDAIDDMGEIYCDMKGMVMGSCDDGGVRDVETSSTASVGTWERLWLGGRGNEETVNQEVT